MLTGTLETTKPEAPLASPNRKPRRRSKSRGVNLRRAVTMKIATTFYRRMILLACPLDKSIPTLRPRLPVEIVALTERDTDAYLAFRPSQKREEIMRRFARGDRCFACKHEGHIVDAGWVATGRVHIPYMRRDLVLRPGDVYYHDAYTTPQFRNRGLYMLRNTHVGRINRAEGYTRGIALVAVENNIPRFALGMLGMTPIGMYGCVRFGPWQRMWRQEYGEELLPELV